MDWDDGCLILMITVMVIWIVLKIAVLIWALTAMPTELRPLAILLLCVV